MEIPKDKVREIAEQSLLIRLAAAGLTKRIERLEKYLSAMPGRVEASLALSASAVLLFSRDVGKKWKLFYTVDKSTIHLLSEAPLTIKMESLSVIPDLLVAIKTSQSELLIKLHQCNKDFDQLATTLEIEEADAV